MTTIGAKLDEHRGVGPGFDFQRIALATCVVLWHVDAVVHGGARGDNVPLLWFPGYAILAMFFALSGFLITGSATRLRLRDFLINRGLRIFPALVVEVVLCALVLGPIFTQLTVADYFANPGTWHYFTNLYGWINFKLPGVFVDLPNSDVNRSLWTVPYEIGCYAIMSAIIIWGLLKRPQWIMWFTAFLLILGALGWLAGLTEADWSLSGAFALFFVGPYSRLFVCFLYGVLAYLFRHRLPYDRRLFAVSVLVCLAVAVLGPPHRYGYPIALVNLIAGPALTYLMAYLGVTKVPTPALFRKGDYSYGIYLYGWPIQQTMMSLFPGLRYHVPQFLLSIVAVAVFAAFSWHCIEKPVLRLRKKFSFVARTPAQDPDTNATRIGGKIADASQQGS